MTIRGLEAATAAGVDDGAGLRPGMVQPAREIANRM